MEGWRGKGGKDGGEREGRMEGEDGGRGGEGGKGGGEGWKGGGEGWKEEGKVEGRGRRGREERDEKRGCRLTFQMKEWTSGC